MKRFIIIDDHYIFRQGVKKIINDAYDHVEFGEAESVEKGVELIRNHSWDLLILDINLPGRSGLDLLNDVKSFNPDLPVLVLSMYEEDQMALRALKTGARGYLTKARTAVNLIDAIERILNGGQYINKNVSELLTNEYRGDKGENLLKSLSDREYFVLLRLATGQSVTSISLTMALSVKTISTYRSRILKKLRLKNTIQLFEFVKDNRLE